MVSATKKRPARKASPAKKPRNKVFPVFRGGISYMTSKGQVTVSANLREALGLKTGDRVKMMLQDDGSVKLERIKEIAEVLASFPKFDGKPMTVREMEELAQEELARGAMKYDPKWQA